MKISTIWRTNLTFGLAILILLVVGAVAVRNARELVKSAHWVSHTHEVLEHLESLLSETKEMESAQRGYMLTGREVYLEHYQDILKEINTEIATVRNLTRDNPVQQKSMDAAEALIHQKIDFSENLIETRQKQGFEASVKLLSGDRGLKIMNRIVAQINAMEQEEESLLKVRNDDNQGSADSTVLVVYAGMGVAILLVLISAILVTRYISLKLKADSQLQAVFNSRDAAESLARDSAQMSSVSEQLATSANEMSRQAKGVSANAEEVSSSVQQVAAAIDEMGASIREIARNASEAARIARQGVDAATATNHTIQELQISSVEMGKVIRLITTVAQQTKLLALNATIEAARAGAAGKGFAVVANEVKDLAKETAQASEEVAERIQAIQDVSLNTIQALTDISGIIEQIADLQGRIASAVEEQSVVTHEITHNVSALAQSSQQISSSIGRVADASGDTAGGAQLVRKTSSNLANLASQLRSLIEIKGDNGAGV